MPTSMVPCTSHSLLSPARRAGVDQQAAPDVAPAAAQTADIMSASSGSRNALPVQVQSRAILPTRWKHSAASAGDPAAHAVCHVVGGAAVAGASRRA